MISTIALIVAIGAALMAGFAWFILGKLTSALHEMATDLQKWAEETQADLDAAERQRANLLKRARLTPTKVKHGDYY